MSAYILASLLVTGFIAGYAIFLKVATKNAPYFDEPHIAAMALAIEADEHKKLLQKQAGIQLLDTAFTLEQAA